MPDKKPTKNPKIAARQKEQLAIILEEMAGKGNNITVACKAAGISYETFYEWERQSDKTDIIKKARQGMYAKRKIHAEDCILKAMDSHWQAAAWHLERRHPDEYALRNREAPQNDEDTRLILKAARIVMEENA